MSTKLMTLDEFHKTHKSLSDGEVILDVRRPDEFQEAHIEGALNIPVDQLGSHVSDLKGFKKIYIHCKRGGRAQTALNTLTSLGFNNVICIHDAGMDAWIERGYPFKKG